VNTRKDRIRSTNDSLRTYASLDFHKNYTRAVVTNEAGAILKEEGIESDPSLMEKFSDGVEEATEVVRITDLRFSGFYKPVKAFAFFRAKRKRDILVEIASVWRIPESKAA
jgi:hypothetical protein